MKIPIIFLGTGAALPTASRNHISMLLKYKNENLLFDCGEGTQRQFRKNKLSALKITRIFISHWHGDHVLGLPGLFETLGLNNYQKILYIYGPKGTKKYINEMFKVFLHTKKIKMKVIEVNGKVFENDDFKITAYPLKHGKAPCVGYVFQEKDKLRIHKSKLAKLKLKNHSDLGKLTKGKDIKVNGKLIKSKNLTYLKKGRKIGFILDTAMCANAKKIAKDADLLIAESTFANDQEDVAKKYNHLTAEQAAGIAKSAKAKQLILTHFSQRYEYKEKILLNEAKKVFKNVVLAKDFMKVEV